MVWMALRCEVGCVRQLRGSALRSPADTIRSSLIRLRIVTDELLPPSELVESPHPCCPITTGPVGRLRRQGAARRNHHLHRPDESHLHPSGECIAGYPRYCLRRPTTAGQLDLWGWLPAYPPTS